MQPSIFTRIIKGELPSHKIHETDTTLAILSIYPAVPGHVLVVPKVQVERIYELTDDDYSALMMSSKKIMRRMQEVFGPDYRICVKVAGFDIPHTHVHLVPCRDGNDFHAKEDMTKEPDYDALAQMAQRLYFED